MKKQNKNNRDTSLISRDALLMQQRRNLDFIIIFFIRRIYLDFGFPYFGFLQIQVKKLRANALSMMSYEYLCSLVE